MSKLNQKINIEISFEQVAVIRAMLVGIQSSTDNYPEETKQKITDIGDKMSSILIDNDIIPKDKLSKIEGFALSNTEAIEKVMNEIDLENKSIREFTELVGKEATGKIKPVKFNDPVMNADFEVKITPNYTIVSIGKREYYFNSVDGEFDGTGSPVNH